MATHEITRGRETVPRREASQAFHTKLLNRPGNQLRQISQRVSVADQPPSISNSPRFAIPKRGVILNKASAVKDHSPTAFAALSCPLPSPRVMLRSAATKHLRLPFRRSLRRTSFQAISARRYDGTARLCRSLRFRADSRYL